MEDKLRELARKYEADPDKYGRDADGLAQSDEMMAIADLVVDVYNNGLEDRHFIPTQEGRREIALYISATRFPEVLRSVGEA